MGVHDIALSKKKQWQEWATNNALEMEGGRGRGEGVDEEGVEEGAEGESGGEEEGVEGGSR